MLIRDLQQPFALGISCCEPSFITLIVRVFVGSRLYCIGVGGSSWLVKVEALELADLGSQSVVVLGSHDTSFNSLVNTVQQLRRDCLGVVVMTKGDKD